MRIHGREPPMILEIRRHPERIVEVKKIAHSEGLGAVIIAKGGKITLEIRGATRQEVARVVSQARKRRLGVKQAEEEEYPDARCRRKRKVRF